MNFAVPGTLSRPCNSPILRWQAAKQQNGTTGVLHDPFGDAANENVRQSRPPVRRHDDQTCVDLFCRINDRLVGDTELYERAAVDAALAQASAHFLELLFSCARLL